MGGFVPEAERDTAFKSFQFIGAVAPDLAVGCAVTKTSSSASAFAYVWSDGHFTQLRIGARPDDDAIFADDPDDGVTSLSTSRGSVEMNAEGAGRKRLVVESPDVSIDLAFRDDETDVLRLCTPTGPTGWAYVQKVVATPASGRVRTATSDFDVASLGALAHHDYTTGFLRPETWWHWACLAARLPDGRRLGLNLSCGTNESGYRENGGWLDDRWFDLDGVLFDFDPDDTERPWRIWGTDGRFDLTFTPGHGYHAHHESDALATNFHQLFGHFDGWLETATGDRLSLANLAGFSESQYLRW